MSDDAAHRGKPRHRIEVADETLIYRSVPIDDLTPTGAQLAAAAGFKPKQHAVVLQVLPNGELEDVRPTEVVDLRHGVERFVIVGTVRNFVLGRYLLGQWEAVFEHDGELASDGVPFAH